MPESRLIIEIGGGMVIGVYTNAPQDFEVDILDRDCGNVDLESTRENTRLEAVLHGPGWRGID